MIKIVHYGPDCESAHYQFAIQYWTKRKRTTSEYIYWKFRGEKGAELNSFILAIENKKVVGQLGLIPCSILLGNEKIEAQWACDLMVDKTHRGKGIANLLYDYAITLKPLTLGSDPSPAASVSMKRAGFISLPGPKKFMFPIYIGEITKLKGFNLTLLNKIPNPFILVLWILKLFKATTKFHSISVEAYTRQINDNLNQPRNSICVIHDESFTNWRFKPFKDYYNGIELYQSITGLTYALYKDKEFYLVIENLAKTISSYLDILIEIVFDAYKNKVKRIKVFANTNTEVKVLYLLGFIPFRTKTEIIFYCEDSKLRKLLSNKYFIYTYMDSDENI